VTDVTIWCATRWDRIQRIRRQRAGYQCDNQILAKQRLIGMVHAKGSGVAESSCAYSMLMQTKDFVDVAARARALGCRVPVRTALLPGNFSTAVNAGEFRYHTATPHVRSAWQSVGLEDEGPSVTGVGGQGSGVRTPVPSPQSLAPFALANVPLVAFFGCGLLTGPEWCLTVALGMVSRVLALHPSCASPRDVRLDIAVERKGGCGCSCIEYQGDAFGIVALCRDVRRIWADMPADRSIPPARAPGTNVVHTDSEAQMVLGLVKSETRSGG
jgi:hypothetical protein